MPVLSGGRYDTLADDFGKHIPAVGFAMGLKRVLVALERQGNLPPAPAAGCAVACEKGAERAAGELCRKLSAGGRRVTLLAEYGEEALRSASADEKYYVTAKGVRKI